MLAINPDHQGGELLGGLTTELMRLGRTAGHDVFWIFTRPANAPTFEQLNFRLLVTDGPVALLEFGGGFERYLAAHDALRRTGRNAAVVVNANPFTLGHLFLVESAARAADTVYLFVVREDRSVFPFDALPAGHRIHAASLPTSPCSTRRHAVSAGTFLLLS
jgi:[citrate (pro-3S)-lyase] ligase